MHLKKLGKPVALFLSLVCVFVALAACTLQITPNLSTVPAGEPAFYGYGFQPVTSINDYPGGDWIVSGTKYITDESNVIVDGNIIITSGNKLVIDNSTLTFNCTYSAQYKISVQLGGNLTISGGSTLTPVNESNHFLIQVDGATEFEILNSIIEHTGIGSEAGSGILINNTNGVWIENSTVYHSCNALNIQNSNSCRLINNVVSESCHNYAIHLLNSTGSTLTNNTSYNNSYYGFKFYNVDNTVINNNTAEKNNGPGFLIALGDNNTVNGNTAKENAYDGFSLQQCYNNTLRWNNATGNAFTLGQGGFHVGYSDLCVLEYNTATNNSNPKPFPSIDVSGIYVSDSNSSKINYNDVMDNEHAGIEMKHSETNEAIGNTVSGNKHGILMDLCLLDNIIQGNTIHDNTALGISINNENGNVTISGNTVTNNGQSGIITAACTRAVTITGNNASYNDYGILLSFNSTDCTISYNTMNNNVKSGLVLIASRECIIDHNNASYNGEMGFDIGSGDMAGHPTDGSLNLTITFNDARYNTLCGFAVSNNSGWDVWQNNTAEFNGTDFCLYNLTGDPGISGFPLGILLVSIGVAVTLLNARRSVKGKR